MKKLLLPLSFLIVTAALSGCLGYYQESAYNGSHARYSSYDPPLLYPYIYGSPYYPVFQHPTFVAPRAYLKPHRIIIAPHRSEHEFRFGHDPRGDEWRFKDRRFEHRWKDKYRYDRRCGGRWC